jgi:hypothetical protein
MEYDIPFMMMQARYTNQNRAIERDMYLHSLGIALKLKLISPEEYISRSEKIWESSKPKNWKDLINE